MSVMAATQVTFPARARPFTAADLDALPDDGRRYELIDGVLIVSPAPSYPHQRAASNLHVLLRSACPDEFEVLFAPLDIKLADDTVLEPDLLWRAQLISPTLVCRRRRRWRWKCCRPAPGGSISPSNSHATKTPDAHPIGS